MEFNIPTIITLSILVIGQVVSIVVGIRKPNEKQDVSIGKFETRINTFEKELTLIRTNHLPHIETDVKAISERLTRIETILDERLPHKN